jgi:hypothetical protein
MDVKQYPATAELHGLRVFGIRMVKGMSRGKKRKIGVDFNFRQIYNGIETVGNHR